jgi:hypothetical protein
VIDLTRVKEIKDFKEETFNRQLNLLKGTLPTKKLQGRPIYIADIFCSVKRNKITPPIERPFQ